MHDDESDDENADNDDDDDEGPLSLRERYKRLKIIGQSVQNHLGDIASTCERIKNLIFWSVPLLTGTVCVGLLVVSAVLYIVPLHLVLMFGVTYVFAKKGFRRLRSNGSTSSPSIIENIVARAPSDLDLIHRRLVPPKVAFRTPRSPPRRTGTTVH